MPERSLARDVPYLALSLAYETACSTSASKQQPPAPPRAGQHELASGNFVLTKAVQDQPSKPSSPWIAVGPFVPQHPIAPGVHKRDDLQLYETKWLGKAFCDP